ncbi:MAG: hypothetical protein HYS40_03615 [Gemmatimonadetes bacterium]|nr:hypothetical protein [Gemmatimonadota bacterium]
MEPTTAAPSSQRLAQLRAEVAREWKARPRSRPPAPTRRRPLLRALVVFALSAAVLGALPFYALVRGSVYLHAREGFPAWAALAAGVLLTLGVVTFYGTWLARRLTGRYRLLAVAQWFALPVVTFYTGYALIYLSSVNVKSPGVRAYYTSVHPLLRVALATVILADRDIVLTDLGRKPQDYARMGLPLNETTLHHRQPDGFVHAVDLRTRGRNELNNRLTQVYFWAMGFDTLRHVGTADHLHVSLPVR